jgi:hypothetical protein
MHLDFTVRTAYLMSDQDVAMTAPHHRRLHLLLPRAIPIHLRSHQTIRIATTSSHLPSPLHATSLTPHPEEHNSRDHTLHNQHHLKKRHKCGPYPVEIDPHFLL